MKIKYNAPTTLTYAFFCTLVVALDQFAVHGLTRTFFSVPNALAFDPMKPLNYLRLFTHIAGHADWNHLLSNMAYILLLGPMLEETYGSFTMFLMIVVTGFVTGVLNACFFPHPLLGASGVVFMMILLASFTNSGKDDIPITFILIMILYLGKEILNAFRGDDISQFAHLAGGLCGSLFGFFKPVRTVAYRRTPTKAAPATRTAPATPATRKSTTGPTTSTATVKRAAPGTRSATTSRSVPTARTAPGTRTSTSTAKKNTEKKPAAKKATMKLPDKPSSK
jgi:membrane associated rhomboid family serine protease